MYALIADYHSGHPRILPPQYFRDLRVDSGGVGEGTTIRFDMRLGGQTRHYRGVITEPVPGRVLVESYPDNGIVTTFKVTPAADGGAADVTISSDVPTRAGLLGAVERAVAAALLRRVFRRELALLADVAR